MKAFSFFALVAGLILANVSRAQSTSFWLSQIRPIDDAVLVQGPRDGYARLIQLIDQAKSSIKMSIYHLSDSGVVDALIRAQARKVSVEVILDNSSLSKPRYEAIRQQLQAANIQVSPSSTGFTLSHSKVMVVDQSLVYLSSQNFVGHSSDMRGFAILTADKDIVKELTQVFQADLENAKNKTALTPTLHEANLLWSPANSEQKLVDLIQSAKISIEATSENLGPDTEVLKALAQASARGVVVRILTPECDLNPNPLFNLPQMALLEKAGVQAHLMPHPSTPEVPYMHAKTMIVDRQVVFIGSENFSINSLRLAREVGMVLSNSLVCSQMEEVFDHDWKVSVSLSPTPPVCPAPNFL